MWLISSVAAFMTSVLVHAIAMRFVARGGAVTIFVTIGGAIGAVLIIYCARSYGWTAATFAATLTYAFACEFYIFLFTLVGNSVSFGLLTKLTSRPLQGAAIAGFYRAEAMTSRRFEQLERGGFIAGGPAGLRLTARGRRLVRWFSLLHAMFGRPNRWVTRMSREGGHAS
jgi:hypothetical protein